MKVTFGIIIFLMSSSVFAKSVDCHNRYDNDGRIEITTEFKNGSFSPVLLFMNGKSERFPVAKLDKDYQPRSEKNAKNVRYNILSVGNVRSLYALLVPKSGLKEEFNAILTVRNDGYHGETGYYSLVCRLDLE
ncbi:MAG: hypothetical protein A4S09_07535 [Proteobacteria bacterium SG_bin7]|nr:MAG: hypothetical protein A4S09_07535 [Proteobacteria bacterium SG_bin7]